MLDRPADDASARHGSAFDHALAPERIEERNKREPENGEIVAVDFLAHPQAERFELVRPDRAQHLLAGSREVTADELRRELAHAERGNGRLRPDGLAAGCDTHSDM